LHGDVGQRDERALLDLYFHALRAELAPSEGLDLHALEQEWRALYVVARADFVRFLAGWAPGSVGPGDLEVVREARRLVR
jgi:hypothetical protein